MLKIFSSFLNILRYKRTISLFLVLGIMTIGVCFGATETPAQYTDTDMTKNIIELFNLIFGILALLLGPMVILAGWLLSPDWTMGDFFGLRPYFLQVWILVANIVYIIFALMLLYMAIMQIFGGPENEYAFKKKLGPFLVGILVVPFTWLIVSWTLTFANEAVAAVLSIPMGMVSNLSTGTTPGEQDTSLWHRKVLPKEFDFSAIGTDGYGDSMHCDGGVVKTTGARCISPAEFVTYNQAGPFFIMMIYAYNIFKIQDANALDLKNFCTATSTDNKVQYQSSKDCIKSLMGIVKKFGLSLVVTIFFGIMLLALCWVLLMRAIKLWIYIMLSPLFGLAIFTGQGVGESMGEGGESGLGSVGIKAFFKLAMVPVLVSAVLAFGLLFVGVVRDNFHSGVGKPNEQGTEYCTKDGVGNMVTYCIVEEPSTDGKGGSTFTSRLIIGTDSRTPNVTQTKKDSKDALIILNFGAAFSEVIGGAGSASIASAGGATAGLIGGVEDIFAHLILTMLALVFMFMGVQIAAKYDAVTEAAFKPFAKLGESVGNFVAHSPSYLPLPHPAFAAMTPDGIKGITRAINSSVDQREFSGQKKLSELISNPGLSGTVQNLKTAGGDPQKNNEILNNISSAASKTVAVSEQMQKNFITGLQGVDKNAVLKDPNDKTKSSDQIHQDLQKLLQELKSNKNPENLSTIMAQEEYKSVQRAMDGYNSSFGSWMKRYSGGSAESSGYKPFDGVKINSDGTPKNGEGVKLQRSSAGEYTIDTSRTLIDPSKKSGIYQTMTNALKTPKDSTQLKNALQGIGIDASNVTSPDELVKIVKAVQGAMSH